MCAKNVLYHLNVLPKLDVSEEVDIENFTIILTCISSCSTWDIFGIYLGMMIPDTGIYFTGHAYSSIISCHL